MTVPTDFYGVPAQGVVEQVDTLTLSATPAAFTKTGVVSYPAAETAGATPTADVITVYDVTTSHALVLNTDYTLTASGSAPETLTYSITRVSSSSNSANGNTVTVTYRYGIAQDEQYQFGSFMGEPAGTTSAPAGTAGFATNQPTTDGSTAGIGDQPAGGSLTDPAAKATGSETGAPGSEYAVNEVSPNTFGYGTGGTTGSPDTEGVYGGATLPENFAPTVVDYGSTANPGVIDTTAAGGSNVVPSMYSSPNGYRAPSSGVAAASKDTTLTDILGNQVNANANLTNSSYAAAQVDTSYSGAPAQPTSLVTQTDTVTAAQGATPYYLSQQGLIPSSIVVTDTSTSTMLTLTTDYTITTAGNGATTVAYVTPVAGVHFTAGNNLSIAYSYGDVTYWDSNPPTSVPAAPGTPTATAVNRGASLSWAPPAGTTPVDYYMVQSVPDLGTLYVPATGMPVLDGQPSPSGGASIGQPTYQADTLTLVTAALAAPATPAPTNATSGGTITAGIVQAKVTYVNGSGETLPSAAGSTTTTTAASTVTVPSPAAETGATGWNVYLTAVGGSTFFKQNAAPLAIGTGYTQTTPPSTSTAQPPAANSTITLSKTGILTPPNAIIVRDVTSGTQTLNTAGEVVGGEADPMQADGQVLEYGYDYTVTQTGIGPWATYQVTLVSSSVNAAAGDVIIVEYWWGADPSTISAVFTQGLYQNTPVIYRPDGSTPYNQGYAFRVAAGNRIGLGPYSALSSYVVPLNYAEAQPGHEGSITVGTGSLDPANAINPIYRPDGTIKAGTGLGG